MVPHSLTEAGVEIIDPVQKYMVKPDVAPWTPTVPDDPLYAPKPKLVDHPDYHETPIYAYNKSTRLLEAERQVLLLTKSQKIDGLPASVESLVGSVSMEDQDILVQRAILQAHKWDATSVKLPKRFNNQLPGWKFKAEKGVPRSRIINSLTSNLLRLCHIAACGTHPHLLADRQHTKDHHIKANYHHHGKPIQISDTINYLMSSARPLAPLASDEQVVETISHQVEDLFPVAATIDLKKQHAYTLENTTGFRAGCSRVPHTLFLHNKDYWYSPECSGRAIMMCFGQATAMAHQKYGADVKELPEPISVQCVHSNGETFHFVAFQLNTLDMADNNGIKNIAWVDPDHKLFNKIIPRRAMLRNTLYEDYDPNVFQKLLAMYVNGVQ